MNFQIIKRQMVIEGLKIIQSNGSSIVDTKRVRRALKIKSNNRTDINFIWRNLNDLEKEGYLERLGKTLPKKYKIIKDFTGI